MGRLKIERVGGQGGFSLPNSKVQSSGEQAISALSAADQAHVEDLFQNPERHRASGVERNTFRYRITRNVNGQDQSVEVPESAVPQALMACVKDKLL